MAPRSGTDERLARLESEMHSLASNFASYQQSTAASIQALANKIDSIVSGQKTPWNTLASWAAVLLVIIGIGGNLVHSTLSDQITLARGDAATAERMSSERHQAQAELLSTFNDRLSLLRGEFDTQSSTNTAKLQRVETQLAGLSNIVNLSDNELWRMISEHHYAITKHHLPDRMVWPTVGRDVGAHEQ